MRNLFKSFYLFKYKYKYIFFKQCSLSIFSERKKTKRKTQKSYFVESGVYFPLELFLYFFFAVFVYFSFTFYGLLYNILQFRVFNVFCLTNRKKQRSNEKSKSNLNSFLYFCKIAFFSFSLCLRFS